MAQQLAQLALVVADYDDAIRFYVERLNFELVEDTVLSETERGPTERGPTERGPTERGPTERGPTERGPTKRWVVVRPKGSHCSLLLAQAATDEQRSRIGNQTGGRVFLFLHTDDFWQDYTRLLANDVNIIREPTDEAYGTVAVFADLYGNLWDLVSRVS